MNQSISQLADAGARLARDFRTLTTHAEELLQATKGATGESVDMARQRLTETLQQARERLSATESRFMEQGRNVANTAISYARAHPWQIVAGALALGLLIGLMGRHGSEAESGSATAGS